MTGFALATVPPTLGFGLMRLPEKNGGIDLEQVRLMADRFLKAGFTYFDTAWGYMDGKSEEALREAVVKRYPRDRFTVATKLPVWLLSQPGDAQRVFETQLERTGAGYFDYYMLHALDSNRLPNLDALGTWEFLSELKKAGKVKNIGFSFHDTADVLDRILTAHPEVDFVQLQLNYVDWESASVQSRLCYEASMRHGKPVVIMEPIKGGSLSNIADEAQTAFRRLRPDDSAAAWAMRFCGSLDNVVAVLSGMSTVEQMEDNIRTMSNFEPLDEAGRAAVAEVRAILAGIPTIPCTACRYCVEDCPQKIQIPDILGHYNDLLRYNNVVGMRRSYQLFSGNPVKASACLECGACEARCPQKIGIIDALKKCVEVFEAR